MANVTTIQTLVDGPRNVVVKVTGVLDTSNVAAATLLDPATLSAMEINGQKASQLRIDKAIFSIQSPLVVNLLWDATSPVTSAVLVGTQSLDLKKDGGLINNAGTGKNGKILYSTSGYTSGTVGFSVVLECVKQ